jgi:type VI secretion system protein ImpH
MGTESGRTGPPLIRDLFDGPYRFDFFQAVRLLQRIYPDNAPVGRDGSPARETVRFRTRASLDFPASQVYEIKPSPPEENLSPSQMTVSFMGLTGMLGVLPYAYTELLIERARLGDRTLWEFLDLFNHRMISLFYRAWEKYRFAVAYERGESPLTEYLFSIVGMSPRGVRGRMSLPDEGLLYYGGLIAQRPHSANAIAAILSDYFGVQACVEQFQGQWLKLEEDSLSRLGRANSWLGLDTIAGRRVWDNQSKFRIKLGPLSLNQFTAFLPGGSAFTPASEMTRFLAGAEFDADFQLVLKAKEVPACVLTTRAKRRPILGWTSWLKTCQFTEDASQVTLALKN